MTNFTELMAEVETLVKEKAAFDVKPTKASSKRLRDSINTIKKMATAAKSDLIEYDASLPKKA